MREDDGQGWPTDSFTERMHTYTHSPALTHADTRTTAPSRQTFVVLASDDDLTT